MTTNQFLVDLFSMCYLTLFPIMEICIHVETNCMKSYWYYGVYNILLINKQHFSIFAGDDVKEKKPDPSIYLTASKRLGVLGKNCLVVEDSIIGLQAATRAGMSCLITYTSSTANQDFKDAIAIYPDLSNVRLSDLELLLETVVAA
uniref:Uncharacterized protein n=1 Tax=Nelumbo nucifera TaxID=4432 RepID=A0A822ZBQ5_NELNU|nr:TPA_asm: hypothetical protein HUJ06_015414 [Nelumbo nucifera]